MSALPWSVPFASWFANRSSAVDSGGTHGSATIPSIRLTENEKVAEEIRDGMGVPTIRSGPKERRPLFAPDRVGCLEDSDHPIIQPDGEVPAGRGEGSSDRYTHAPEFEL